MWRCAVDEFFKDKVDLARGSLYPPTPEQTKARLVENGFAEPDELNDDHLEWYKNDKALADAIQAAETDPALFAFLKNWVSGNLELEFPDPVPAPLIGFMRDLIGGRFKQPRGNAKRELGQAFLKSLVDEIILVYGGTKRQAVEAIAEASGLSVDGVQKMYYRRQR